MNQPIAMTVLDQRQKAVLRPILYADIFDFPLTQAEVYRFIEIKTTPAEVEQLLLQAVEAGQLAVVEGFFSLPHRTELAPKRQERERASALLWPKAGRYGRWLAALPFVRMVAVTGSLAVDNPRDGADVIVFLVGTRPGRLWMCRAMMVMLVRLGHLGGVHLCPNYIVTENRLSFDSQDFFTAREVIQMQPLYGEALYRQMVQANAWIARFFPHGSQPSTQRLADDLTPAQQGLKRVGEFILAGVLGNRLESIVQRYQVAKHTRLAEHYGQRDRVVFNADECKGHYDGHKRRAMAAYRRRMQEALVE
ncbi:MAG TPA: hypothetical protein PKD98_08975 [Anaerolineae bacterium]|nr:hypothetical protein [Anaerolineae bacterium]